MASSREIRFPAPDEVEGYFGFDKMHAPRPIRPLTSDLVIDTLAAGFNEAMEEYDSPVVTDVIVANHYFYLGYNPHRDRAVIDDRMTRYMGFVERIVPLVGKRWSEEWLPLIRSRNEAERDRDYSAMPDEEIFAHYFDMRRWMRELWYIHGHINYALISGTDLSDFYDEVMTPEDPTEAYQILQGYHTRPVDVAHSLWTLSRVARSNPELLRIFTQTDPRDLKTTLAASQEGRSFLTRLDEFLHEFGWRGDAVYDLADVTWVDDPTIPLGNIARFVSMGEEGDPMIAFEDSVRRREERTAAIRDRLEGDPARLAKFERLLGFSKHAYPLTEDHSFYIDQMGVALLRRFLRALGQRLAARGCLEAGDDIFYLYDREVRDAMVNDTDHRALVVERKAHYEACCRTDPAPSIGTPPPPLKPGDFVDPFIDAQLTRLLGYVPRPEGAQVENVIDGVAGSPGTYTGKARVVLSLEQAGALQEGEVMVCEMSLPPWVPMFAIAGAVVADVGGVMSHCAIVAREFGIPAVVGSVRGTKTIVTGQIVTVDGTNGNVHLEGRST